MGRIIDEIKANNQKVAQEAFLKIRQLAQKKQEEMKAQLPINRHGREEPFSQPNTQLPANNYRIF